MIDQNHSASTDIFWLVNSYWWSVFHWFSLFSQQKAGHGRAPQELYPALKRREARQRVTQEMRKRSGPSGGLPAQLQARTTTVGSFFGHGDGSKPIITMFGGITIHLPAIFVYHPGTRVLTHNHMVMILTDVWWFSMGMYAMNDEQPSSFLLHSHGIDGP